MEASDKTIITSSNEVCKSLKVCNDVTDFWMKAEKPVVVSMDVIVDDGGREISG